MPIVPENPVSVITPQGEYLSVFFIQILCSVALFYKLPGCMSFIGGSL